MERAVACSSLRPFAGCWQPGRCSVAELVNKVPAVIRTIIPGEAVLVLAGTARLRLILGPCRELSD